MAILPGNILIDSVSSTWMAYAVQLVLQTDLATSPNVVTVLANDDSGAQLEGAQDVIRATVTERNGRIGIVTAIIKIATQQDSRIVDLEGASSPGILPLLDTLAKRIEPGASQFSTKSNRALQAYVTAILTSNAQQRIAALTDAISIDPSFGMAYIALADADAQAAPQSLAALLQSAARRTAAFTPLDRARFNAFLARYSHVPLPKEQAAFEAVLHIAPYETDALVAAGSICFLRGNAADGTRYLHRAVELNPGNLNIRKALADGLFQTRRFVEAEKLLVAMDSNPAVLPELAICVLLEGDPVRANTIAERLFASIRNPDAKTLFRAVWLNLSGQSQKAVQLVTTTKFTEPAVQALAYCQLSMWQMLDNDFPAARQSAARARELDPRPSSFASIAMLLVAANGPAPTWKSAVDASFVSANQPLKSAVLGYGFFLGRHYAEATQVWTALVQQTGGADLRARTMLAASLIALGRADQARGLQVEPFVPDFGDLYASVSFFEMNRVLGITVH